jgi:pSer/pThr/pTyr-binding forkhead associated (FHA) protein
MRTWLIGSDPDSDLVVDRPTVSRRHCRLTQDGEGFLIEDLGSSNGTFVNGVRVRAPVRVSPRDAITLGASLPMPWPEVDPGAGTQVIRIGRETDNDVVLDDPGVSAYHAQVLLTSGVAVIEDLGSTNGTFVGSIDNPIRRAPLSASDTVFLGTFPLPAALLLIPKERPIEAEPLPAITFHGPPMIVGRDQDCDQVIDAPVVSGRHARLATENGRITIEDLGSSNGTFVNGQLIARATVVTEGDRIGLGGFVARLAVDPGVIPAPVKLEPAPVVPEEIPSAPLDRRLPPRAARAAGRAVFALAHATLLAGLIVLAFGPGAGAPVTPASWPIVASNVAWMSFALGLTALWLGAANGVRGFDRTEWETGIPGSPDLASKLIGLGALGLGQCALLLAIVGWGTALHGPWLTRLGLLAMAMAVGLALGLVVSALARSRAVALASLVAIVLAVAATGAPWLEPVAPVSPARWAFEGLLLLESAQRPTWRSETPEAKSPIEEMPRDMAEPYFPAATERMGVRADVTALGAMLLGLIGLLAAIAPRRQGGVAAGSGGGGSAALPLSVSSSR